MLCVSETRAAFLWFLIQDGWSDKLKNCIKTFLQWKAMCLCYFCLWQCWYYTLALFYSWKERTILTSFLDDAETIMVQCSWIGVLVVKVPRKCYSHNVVLYLRKYVHFLHPILNCRILLYFPSCVSQVRDIWVFV